MIFNMNLDQARCMGGATNTAYHGAELILIIGSIACGSFSEIGSQRKKMQEAAAHRSTSACQHGTVTAVVFVGRDMSRTV